MFARILTASVIFVWLLPAAEQQYAALGDLKLESGAVIKDCRIGYRTYGTLDPARSNTVLWPTWFSGTTVDAIGNGISMGGM